MAEGAVANFTVGGPSADDSDSFEESGRLHLPQPPAMLTSLAKVLFAGAASTAKAAALELQMDRQRKNSQSQVKRKPSGGGVGGPAPAPVPVPAQSFVEERISLTGKTTNDEAVQKFSPENQATKFPLLYNDTFTAASMLHLIHKAKVDEDVKINVEDDEP